MRFIVTYRDRSGSKATELIKAETRVECFAECRRLGITPMSVQQQAEVSNKCERISAHATVQLKKNSFNKGFLFCIFISLLIASILAWLWLSQSDAPISITQIPNKIKKDVRFKNIKPIEKVTAKPVNSDAISLPKMSRVKHPVTGESLIITQKVVKLLPNASRIGTVFTNNLFKPPKKLYKTFSENYVANLMRVQIGMPVVGGRLPHNFDEEFKAHIDDPIEILPDDTEDDIKIKKQMIEVKKEMARLIANGASPREIILSERRELNSLAQMRRNFMKDLADYRRSGASKQDVAEYIEAANKILDEHGVKHIKLPLEPITKISNE